MRHFVIFVSISAFGIIALCSPVFANDKEKGLTTTPLRAQTNITAGDTKVGKFAIKNDAGRPLNVTVSVERFGVKNGTYEYEFDTPKNGWVQLRGEKEITLNPNEEREILYDITTPKDAPTGGHYYALLASMDVPGASITSDLRVASLLYLTVEGSDLSMSSQLGALTASKILLGPVLDYRYEVKNTGNIHYTVSNYGHVKGLDSRSGVATSYTLMPGTTRTIRESITMPLLPGIYTLTYGFRDAQKQLHSQTAIIIYLPPWSIAASVGGLFIIATYRTIKKRR